MAGRGPSGLPPLSLSRPPVPAPRGSSADSAFHDWKWRRRHPAAAGEVGHRHRPAALGHRLLAQPRDRAPGRRVVDVLVGGPPAAQALDEALVHQVVHAPVAALVVAYALRLPQRVLELLVVILERLPLLLLAPPLDVDAVGPALDEPARALQHADAAVGPRAVGVVGEEDRLAVDGTDQGRVDVAQLVALTAAWVIGREVLGSVELEPARVPAHRDDVVEAVAAVDVHALGDGSQAVGGVQVPVPVHRVGAAPEPLAVPPELDRAQVVQIAALPVEQLAEQAALGEDEGQHLAAVVAAVDRKSTRLNSSHSSISYAVF